MTPFLLRLGAAGVAVLLAGAAQAQSCTTIGSSTFCGARGSHNTVGNTMIFNQGPAGQRVGGYAIIGTPPRTQVIRGAERSPLAAPRSFSGISANKRFAGSGPYYDSRIAALRAEALALEAQQQLEQLELTPAQKAAAPQMSPALVRALTLAKEARRKAAAEGNAASPAAD
ncbi:MAG TPA: hypothetical protein VIS03_11005 [Kiloniellaceae bacterium]